MGDLTILWILGVIVGGIFLAPVAGISVAFIATLIGIYMALKAFVMFCAPARSRRLYKKIRR